MKTFLVLFFLALIVVKYNSQTRGTKVGYIDMGIFYRMPPNYARSNCPAGAKSTKSGNKKLRPENRTQ
jgi:hypothetical protein